MAETPEEKAERKSAEQLAKRVQELETKLEERAADDAAEGLLAEQAAEGTIVERLARVGERLQYVRRGGAMRSSGANFTYATIDQLRAAVRPLLGHERVTMVPHDIEVVRSEERAKGDRAQFDTLLRVTWRFSCPYLPDRDESKVNVPLARADLEGLAWMDVPSYGRSLNNSDKDFNTALTYAERNALLATFHLESGDDPEQERPEATPRTAPRGSSAPRDYGAMGTPPTSSAEPPTTEQRGEASRIRLALAPVVGGEDVVNGWVARFAQGEFPDTPLGRLNRDQFQVLLEGLRGQVAKVQAAGHLEGWDPKTGEIVGDAPPTPDPVPAPPADTPEAPVPAASEEVQQQIEAAAAQTPIAGAPVSDPDGDAPSAWEEAKQLVVDSGLDEVDFLELAMGVGAARPADLEDPKIAAAFQEALAARMKGEKA